ncbi:hypothetical protein ACFE04_007856 [Oxalis oulophora]
MDFSLAEDHQDPHHHQVQAPAPAATVSVEKEHMFDKVVTPSDVGKLNRLVIPKQHAERYFPLDSSTNEKGLLLNFEDRNAKLWRFRYSYWNSSQSYVMTKGWSRFVKEKKLEAGDIVSFQRGVGDLGKDRLFIDWRRRPEPHELSFAIPHHHHRGLAAVPWNLMRVPPPPPVHLNTTNFMGRGSYSYNQGLGFNHYNNYSMDPMYYLRSQQQQQQQQQHHHHQREIGMLDWQQPMVFESVPVVQGKVTAKRLRLFGVNMECPIDEDETSSDVILSSNVISPSSSSTLHYHHEPTPTPDYHSSNNPSSSNYQLQLRLFNGTPMQMQPSSSKGKSSMSLDLDI